MNEWNRPGHPRLLKSQRVEASRRDHHHPVGAGHLRRLPQGLLLAPDGLPPLVHLPAVECSIRSPEPPTARFNVFNFGGRPLPI